MTFVAIGVFGAGLILALVGIVSTVCQHFRQIVDALYRRPTEPAMPIDDDRFRRIWRQPRAKLPRATGARQPRRLP